tara:strand:- start:274 stop:453 length:180 start_codon:yes stop_codon:yes gene_type:complete
MSLSPHKQHKIYIAARMGFGIGSEDPEELAYYDMVKKERKEEKRKEREKGICIDIKRTD